MFFGNAEKALVSFTQIITTIYNLKSLVFESEVHVLITCVHMFYGQCYANIFNVD